MKKIFLILTGGALISAALTGCDREEEVQTAEVDMLMVDSIVQVRLDSITTHLTTQCSIQVANALDSAYGVWSTPATTSTRRGTGTRTTTPKTEEPKKDVPNPGKKGTDEPRNPGKKGSEEPKNTGKKGG